VDSSNLLSSCRLHHPRLRIVSLWRFTRERGTDAVVSMVTRQLVSVSVQGRELATDGCLAAVLAKQGKPWAGCLVAGSKLESAGLHLESATPALSGKILDVGPSRRVLLLRPGSTAPELSMLTGQTIFAIQGKQRRAYPIVGVDVAEGRTRVFTKTAGRGFEARTADRYELPLTVSALVDGQ